MNAPYACSRRRSASATPCARCTTPRARTSRRPTSISTSPSCSAARSRAAKLRLFMIYPAGNFIECTIDTPYLQIGEHKYGKPVLDRAISYDVDVYDALKIGLISMDSTMRSNLGVGMPIDIMVAKADALDADLVYRIEAGEPYYPRPARALVVGAARRHQNIPRPPYRAK